MTTPLNRELWSYRIPQDFEKAYFEAVQEGKALNLPEQLADAIEAKGVQAIAGKDTVDALNRYAGILNEKA